VTVDAPDIGALQVYAEKQLTEQYRLASVRRTGEQPPPVALVESPVSRQIHVNLLAIPRTQVT
jgi:hypothetical protein